MRTPTHLLVLSLLLSALPLSAQQETLAPTPAQMPQASPSPATPNRFKPLLEVRYGWRDGMRANTVGIPRNGDPLPLLSVEIGSGYGPDQVGHAYGFDALPTNAQGEGQTIAIIGFGGNTNLQSDLDTFCAYYGIPSTTINVYHPWTTNMPVQTDPGWSLELDLDVEWAHALAPNAAIDVVLSDGDPSVERTAVYAANTLGASVLSMSLGGVEEPGVDNPSVFNLPATCVAGSGDQAGIRFYPSSSPYVLSVGGTILDFTAVSYDMVDLDVLTEGAWADSGGGPSTETALPTWQATLGLGSWRTMPDVAAIAGAYPGAQVYFTWPSTVTGLSTLIAEGYATNGWESCAGTSLATPIWAALIADRNSYQEIAFAGPINAQIYAAAVASPYYFRDMTNWGATDTGDTWLGTNPPPFAPYVGYDMVTGWGSPNAQAVILIGTTNAPPVPPVFATSTPTPTPPPTPTPTPVPPQPTIITVSGFPNNPVVGTTYTITAVADSGAPVTLSANTNGLNNPIFVTPNQAYVAKAGYAIFTASAPATNNYLATNMLIVRPNAIVVATPTPTPTPTPSPTPHIAQHIAAFTTIPNKTYGAAPFTVTPPKASSSLPVTMSVLFGPATVASNTITLTGVGTVTLAADQSGNSTTFLPAPRETTAFKVVPAPQKIAPFAIIPSKVYGDGSFTVPSPASSSGFMATLSVLSGPATISGNTVTLTGAGTVVLAANAQGDATHFAAPRVTTSFKVAKANQVISFSTAITEAFVQGASFSLGASSSSLQAVHFSSSNSKVISLSGTNNDTATIKAKGSTVITAFIPASANYNAAKPVAVTVKVQ